jgi:hypothetical protein
VNALMRGKGKIGGDEEEEEKIEVSLAGMVL